MNKKTRTDAVIIIVLLIIAGAVAFAVFGGKKESKAVTSTDKEVTAADYNGKKIGILSGTNMEQASFEHFPDSEYSYYNNVSDMASSDFGRR